MKVTIDFEKKTVMFHDETSFEEINKLFNNLPSIKQFKIIFETRIVEKETLKNIPINIPWNEPYIQPYRKYEPNYEPNYEPIISPIKYGSGTPYHLLKYNPTNILDNNLHSSNKLDTTISNDSETENYTYN